MNKTPLCSVISHNKYIAQQPLPEGQPCAPRGEPASPFEKDLLHGQKPKDHHLQNIIHLKASFSNKQPVIFPSSLQRAGSASRERARRRGRTGSVVCQPLQCHARRSVTTRAGAQERPQRRDGTCAAPWHSARSRSLGRTRQGWKPQRDAESRSVCPAGPFRAPRSPEQAPKGQVVPAHSAAVPPRERGDAMGCF